ncbi:oxygenase MpaB family protein [Mycobacterium bourgelatii]|uniref:ER-bound oxygenase mpaB/mpaB'/Rubber oxygenase catalytic domain-containing protein n=1 Tax=Mycobacterium bourgelatii TaxID=1273442 RepID=A0A7I9YWW1_MYCBU|nr:oxygenase MpaB family protein [Mycobacterium bourgelatii]MCV6973093.1 DUF2236 domain-containing protein [Mycobacterium bourgelatii]GFG93125.1 hypothetical protein MBOU_51670 [Mycobacterium bourgelatii]
MNQAVPARHPDGPRPVPPAIRLLALVLGLRGPNAEEMRRLGERLTVGDEPMDRLVEWMSAAGMEQTRPLFERALLDGIANVPDAPEPLRDFFVEVETVPDWVDWDLVRRGQKALRSGGADGMYVARDVSLLGGYQFAAFNQTLLRTGALEKGSNKRFAETMQWAMDVISKDGLAPLGVGYRSTLRVRFIHALVRRHVATMPDWRADLWGLPINQTDMAATLVGALIAPPVGGIGMGILLTPREFDAIAHVTRYAGWLMGVHEEWLPQSFRDGVRILYHTLSAISTPDETTKQLAVPMAADPLSWNYECLPSLRRRLAWAQHLSVTSGFLGRGGMATLGLPTYIPPVYPLLRFPFNVTRSLVALSLPGGRSRAAVRGEREHKALMQTMIGDSGATVGEAATHVDGVA